MVIMKIKMCFSKDVHLADVPKQGYLQNANIKLYLIYWTVALSETFF